MTWQLLGNIASAFILAILVKVFVGGMYIMWVALILSAILVYQSGITWAQLSTGGRKAKVFAWTVLITIFLVNILARMTGKTLDVATSGADALSLLLFASLLAMFATKEAGWTDGKTGKKWIIRLFVATFIYAIACSIWPSVPKAVDRFVADTNWLADSYGERKLIKEVSAAKEALDKDFGRDKKDRDAAQRKVAERPEPVLMPDGSLYLPPSAEFMLGAGTEQKFRFGSLGFVAITGNHTILCDPRCTDRSGKVVAELPVRTEEWKREYGDKPCLTDKETFYVKIRGDEKTTIKARTPNDPPCKS